MTKTEQIIEELLACSDDSEVKLVMAEYAGSKGPLYNALSQASARLRHRLDAARKQNSDAEDQRDLLARQVKALQTEQPRLEAQVNLLEERVFEEEVRLGEVHELLERGKRLEDAGFIEEHLEHLRGMLAQIAESQELPVEDVLTQFFDAVNRYGPLVSLELEIKKAEQRAEAARAEVERWESQARLTEERCEDREAAIDSVQRMLAEGIAEDDMILWAPVLQDAGTTVGELAEHLKRYGSLEALTRTRRTEAEELQAHIPLLKAEVQALSEQRSNAEAGIHAVQEEALDEIGEAGRQAANVITKAGEQAQEIVQSLNIAGARYADLREEVAVLTGYVELGRAFSTEDPEVWRELPKEVIRHAIKGIIAWSRVEDRNVQLPPPGLLKFKAGAWTRLTPAELLTWALLGTFSEEERLALSTAT